jgi:hypothetical protein
MKVKVVKLNQRVRLEDINLEQVEIIASLGMTDEEIAVILGISPRTLNYWKKTPVFLQSLKRGKLKADFQITKSLYEKAKGGDTTAMIFWLKNRRPDLWRDRQELAHSGELKVALSITDLRKSMSEYKKNGS